MFADTEYNLITKSLKDRVDAVWGPVEFLGHDCYAGEAFGGAKKNRGKKVFAIPEAYRISSEYMSINSFVAEMAETLQFDYYYEVRHRNFDEDAPVKDQYEDGGGLIEEADIVLRTVNKGIPPTPNAISQYIADRKNEGKDVANYEIGKELADATTQKVVMGGPRERFTLANTSYMRPLWGKNQGGSSPSNASFADYGSAAQIFGFGCEDGKDEYKWWDLVEIPIPAEAELLKEYFGQSYKAYIFEIRLARGDRNSWEIFKVFDTMSVGSPRRHPRLPVEEPNGMNSIYGAPWTSSLDPSDEAIQYLFSNEFGGNSLSILTNTSRALRSNALYFKEKQDLTNELWELVNNVATQYYCKKFAVPLFLDLHEQTDNWPYSTAQRLAYIPKDEFRVQYSWELAGSAWTQRVAADWQFMDDKGKTVPLASWKNKKEYTYSSLGTSWSLGVGTLGGQILSNGVSIDQKKYFKVHDPECQRALSHCIMDTGAQVDHYDFMTTADFGLSFFGRFFYVGNNGEDGFIDPSKYLMPGHKNLQLVIPPDVAVPSTLGIPEVSNRYNYGPWIAGISFKGKAEIEARKELTPDLLGSWENLNAAGISYAAFGSADTIMTENESGTMKVTGAPEGNVGQRFAETGPYVTNMTINAEPNGGVTTTYQFNTWTPSFGKLARYNIERLAKVRSNLFSALREFKVEREKLKQGLPGRTLEAMALPEDTKGGKNGNLTKAGFQQYDADTISSIIRTPKGQAPGDCPEGQTRDPETGECVDNPDGPEPGDPIASRDPGGSEYSDGSQRVKRNQGTSSTPVNNNMDVTAMPWFNPNTD